MNSILISLNLKNLRCDSLAFQNAITKNKDKSKEDHKVSIKKIPVWTLKSSSLIFNYYDFKRWTRINK